MLSATVVRRLTASRFYLGVAAEYSRSTREIASYGSINLLQDAVEFFLIAAAEHTSAAVSPRTELDKYFTLIDEKIKPRTLPFRPRLLQLNKARVHSKHDGIRPDAGELQGFVTVAREFLIEATQIVFGEDFTSVSLLSQLNEGEVREELEAAEMALREDRASDCMIHCRRAFYLTFETPYDIGRFRNKSNKDWDWLDALGCRSPRYTQSAEYIEESVRTPFDLIVLDHEAMDRELLKEGVDPDTFWNIWRLTPAVYRREDGLWLTRNDLSKLNRAEVASDAAYVFDQLVDMLHLRQLRKERIRWVRGENQWSLTLRAEHIPVYAKADRNGAVLGSTPAGVTEVTVTGSTPGLNDDELYWEVSDMTLGSPIWYGYIHDAHTLPA